MKITKIVFAAFLAIVSVSCEKEPALNSNSENASESNMVPLILSTGGDTKTSLVGNEIHWSEGDLVAVYDNRNNSPRSAKAQDINGNRANFHCKVSGTAIKVCAVYPYSTALECDLASDFKSDYVKVKVLGEQTAAPGTFADDHNISVAFATISGDLDKDGLSNTKNVAFKNVCSLLKFTLPEANKIPGNIESVMLSSESVIAGTMKVNGVDSEFEVESVVGTNSITMEGSFEAGKTYCFVLAPVLLDGLSISVRMEDGTVYGMGTSSDIEMTMGKYRSLGTLDFTKMSTFSYSAEHDFQNSVLQGTNVKVNFPSADVSNVNITITKGDVVMRSMTDDNLTIENGKKVAVSRSNDAAWPYLPSGIYTISGYYTMAGEEITISPATLTVARPEGITITGFNAYTSYTKYNAGDVSGANALKGSLIYVQASNINVSAAILAKYANLLSLDYISSGKEGSIVTGTLTKEVAAPAYGEYSDFKYSFDGVVGATMSSKCHVTGIPYVLNPAANDSLNPWTESGNVAWKQGGSVRLGYNLSDWGASSQASIKKFFDIPKDLDVVLTSTGSVIGYRGLSSKSTTFSISVSGISKYNVSSNKNSDNIPIAANDVQASLFVKNPSVECHNSEGYSTACSQIKTFTIKYR
jgi:hypothetical protein